MSILFKWLSGAMPILIAIVVFGVLIIVHEFGHFIAAKKNGISVLEFSIGMGPLLFSKKKGETLYSVRALPFGGYCKMLGEDESNPDEHAFNNKSVLSRISVIFAGPLMNFVLAFVLAFILLSTSAFVLPVVSDLKEGSPAEAVGIEIGDSVTYIDGRRIRTYEDLKMAIMDFDGSEVKITVKRGDESVGLNLTPQYSEEDGGYIIGIIQTIKTGCFAKTAKDIEKASLAETIKASFFTGISYIKSVINGFAKLITFQVSKNEISGPVGIMQIIGESYEEGMESGVVAALRNIIYLAAVLSANLGAVNLFPIPAVDGGRIVFLIIEGIRGKAIPPEKEGFVHFVGFALLMAFIVFITFNDIMRILS
ncbi:MAG: RIP metalloprotease RseP [Lachnospiraceae bacterium]|nr:RIP metalloprotease RseP [Lachnospiraceae bacterium]